jgi:FAD/FMN-containing dehydrogenase
VNRATNRIPLSIPELRSAVKGTVLAPDDSGYDDARTTFYGGFDARPAAIVLAADPSDVSSVVSLARDEGHELAVRSGGHSVAGHCTTEGGIVLDLRNLNQLDIDVTGQTAWVGPGLTAEEFTKAAATHGLALGFGDAGSVGIGGITLGGGVGFLARKYGLTIDSLLAADIVTADGRLRRANAERHPDLFWAIRGGGGNFGVVTRLHFRLHEVDKVFGGMLILPATPDAITSFVSEAEAAPEEVSTIANIMMAPPMPFLPEEAHGKLIILALMTYAGDVDAGERAIAPFRAIERPIVDMMRPMTYPEMYLPEESDYHPTAVSRTMFVETVDRNTADTILEYIRESDAMMRVAQLRVLGGAVARVPVDATAYAHRRARIMANVAAFYDGEEDKAVRNKWVADFAASLGQDDSPAYVNFLGEEGRDRVRDAYPGSIWDRLVEIKGRYDPTNLFRVNQNIPPAGSN